MTTMIRRAAAVLAAVFLCIGTAAAQEYGARDEAKALAAASASGKGEGWVDYERLDPQIKKTETKTTFVKRVPAMNYVVHVGAYR